MLREAIFHQSGGAYAYPVARDVLLVQLRAAKDDLVGATLIYGDRYQGADATERVTMEKYASDLLFDYFRARLHLATRKFRYMFCLDDGKEQVWYNEFGFTASRPVGYHSGYFHYPYITERDMFEVPAWVKDAVIYQIFPDRFYNGDPTNDPEGVMEWGKKPENQYNFFGGDLAGITAKLPYLEDLGVNTLYLTPIFAALTNHKYDTKDYFEIDPVFGEKDDFRKLVAECHRRGMRIVLDAVFNHCGYYLAQFQDVLEKGEASPYRDWFYIENYPVSRAPLNYEAFAGTIWNMPKLRTANPEVRDFLLKVGEYWIKEFDIDGWRLDVANEIDHAFWREFRTKMREAKRDLYIIGEVWHHSDAYLQGDQFDAVMNYHFRDVISRFIGERSLNAEEFDARLTLNRVTYREQAVKAAWNLLGSHDTERILTRFQGDKAKLRLAFTMQMTYPGVPYIYAGDEIGIEGKDDPDNRRCMIWEEEGQDLELKAFFKKLIAIRKECTPLRYGEFRTVRADSATGIYIYERYTAQERALVAINNSDSEQPLVIDLKALGFDTAQPIRELLQNEGKAGAEAGCIPEDGILCLTVGPMGAVILAQ